MIFEQYVICQKRVNGTAILSREEFLDYSKDRRNRDFCFICWITCKEDEDIATLRFPRIRWAIKRANDFGLGNRG